MDFVNLHQLDLGLGLVYQLELDLVHKLGLVYHLELDLVHQLGFGVVRSWNFELGTSVGLGISVGLGLGIVVGTGLGTLSSWIWARYVSWV